MNFHANYSIIKAGKKGCAKIGKKTKTKNTNKNIEIKSYSLILELHKKLSTQRKKMQNDLYLGGKTMYQCQKKMERRN